MVLVYAGIYTLFLVSIWGFFVISKIHAYKFKNFSEHIKKVTVFITYFLIFLSILGYVLIFFAFGEKNYSDKEVPSNDNFIEETNY